VIVKKINDGAINDQTRMRDGFIITKVNGKPVKSVDELRSVVGNSKVVKVEGVYPGYEETFEYPLDLADIR
jgi:S1-C subfamily serine protease